MRVVLEVAVSNAILATGLAVLAATIGPVTRQPALRHALWLLVLLKLVTPPLVLVPTPWLGTAETRAPADPPPPLAPADGPATPADPGGGPSAGVGVDGTVRLLALWTAGTAAWFALAAIQTWRARRLWRGAQLAPEALGRQARTLTDALGLRWCPEVWTTPATASPLTWWLGGPPRILLPSGLLASLDAEQQATLLAHELAHLRRRDHWIRWLEVLVAGLYWWHPVVWWARRALHQAEEECCDAWVLTVLPGARHTYAYTLLQTLDFLSETGRALPLLASGMGRFTQLRRRLTMIMTVPHRPGLNYSGRWGLLTVAMVSLLVAFVSEGQPQEPPGQGLPKDKGELRLVQGKVERFTTAPKGEVHGFRIDSGIEVHFPPHLEKRVTNAVDKGDEVRVAGWWHTDPKGETKLEAVAIANLTRKISVQFDGPPGPGPKDKKRGERKTVQGKIERFKTAPRGEIDGFWLDSGTEVHFPPHLEKRVTNAVDKGDQVRVTGWEHAGPKGDTKLEATTITVLTKPVTVILDGPPDDKDSPKKK
jgi:beta-lactamase regulating signal transducer with metallopeptidase domain